MPRNPIPLFSLFACLLVAAAATPPLQAEEHVIARLDTVEENQVRERQARTRRDPEALLTALGTLDDNIRDAQTRIEKLETAVTGHTEKLANHLENIDTSRTLTDAEQGTIRVQLRATWRLYSLQQRRAERYNQKPADWRRTQRYIMALSQQLERRRGKARLALVDVMATVHEADAVKRALVADQRDLSRELNNLKHLLASRQPVLIQLEAATARAGNQLITVYAEDDSVRDQLATVDTALADSELPWPLVGAVHTAFGDKKPESSSQWQGIQIGSAPGNTVHAVQGGVVVYAGWLRGQGLLTIVDHGDGMMAVYGNNRRLLAEVGDIVETGDPIATVGANTQTSDTSLYFELRVEGEAVDPLQWLSAKPG